MKIYPKHDGPREQAGFTAEEIKRGIHWLYADVKCQECGKVQSLATAGSTDNGKCIKCGGKTA
jgi:ribosomal protein S27E